MAHRNGNKDILFFFLMTAVILAFIIENSEETLKKWDLRHDGKWETSGGRQYFSYSHLTSYYFWLV